MVSVITPTYNRPEMLSQAIDSVLRQDYPEVEMVIVNDCSKASYGAGYDALYDKYHDKCKFIYMPENSGCPKCLNEGIKASSGDLICVLADDDLMNGSMSLSARSQAFSEPTVDVIYTGAYSVDASNNVMDEQRVKPINKKLIWKQDYINIQSMMWRRSVHNKIGFFSEDLTNNEDWEWKIKCLMECEVKALDIISVRSRYHGDNKSIRDRHVTNKCAHILLKRMEERYGKKS